MSDDAFARGTDPAESRNAAARVHATALCDAVVAALEKFGAMTTNEIATRTGLPLVSISPRMKPLLTVGRVRRTGERRNGSAIWEAITPLEREACAGAFQEDEAVEPRGV